MAKQLVFDTEARQDILSGVQKLSKAVAVTRNAVLVANAETLTCLDIATGNPLWSQPLPVAPVPWGITVNRDGCVIVVLEEGQIVCFN